VKERRGDEKRKVLDCAMEQPTFVGIGNSRLGIRNFRFNYFRVIAFQGIHYPRGYRSGLLSDRRRTYEHAVRMGKEKSRQ
jgi:hypothetical protein